MFIYRREISEELWQLFLDFPSDCPGSVLKLWGRDPTGDNVMGVDLEESTDDMCRHWTEIKKQQPLDQEHLTPSAADSSHLYEGDVSRKLLLDVLEVLQWLPEGGEVCDHRP